MINFGQLSRRFIPPTTRFGINPDINKFNSIYSQGQIPQPTVPNIQRVNPYATDPEVNQQQPPQSSQDDFLTQYDKLSSNRPNRLAYQQAVEQGPEEIKRSGWLKLLSAAGAGAGAFGGQDVGDAVNTAVSAYNAPQARANAKYKDRITGLGNLATMEDSDIQEKLKALEMQRSEGWKQKDYELSKQREEREGKVSAAQVEQMGEDKITDRNGDQWVIASDGSKRFLGHVNDSPEEKLQHEKDLKNYEQDLKSKADEASDLRQRETQYGVANIQAGRTTAAMKPDDILGHLQLALGKKIGAGELPKEAADYLQLENNIPVAKYPHSWYGLSEGAKSLRDRVQQFIGDELGNLNTPKSNTPVSKANTSTTPPTVSNTPAPTGKVTVSSPDGKEQMEIDASELPHWLSEGAKLVTPPTTNTPAPAPVVNQPPVASAPPIPNTQPPVINTPQPPINPPQPPPTNIPQPNVNFRPSALGGFNPNTANPSLGFVPPLKNIPQPPIPQQSLPVRPFNVNNIPGAKLSASAAQEPANPQSNISLNPARNLSPNSVNAPTPNKIHMVRGNEEFDVEPDRVKKFLDLGFKPSAPISPNPITLSNNTSKPVTDPKEVFDSKLKVITDKVKKETGYGLKVISGTRSAEEQAKLYAQGRTTGKKGRIVTNADGTTSLSKHQTGEAADLRFVDKNGKVIEGNKKLQQTLGKIAKEEGLVWGGDWKDPYDPLHIEVGRQ